MREKLKVHDGDTPGKVIEVKLEYPKPKVATMTDMKCPVCNVGYVHESVNHWCCDYEFCPSYDETDTETYDILIRTRKALDVALDWLGQVATPEKCDDDLCREFTKRKLIEIKTALEQKD